MLWQDVHLLDGAFDDALDRNSDMGRITRSNLIRIVFASSEHVGGLASNVAALETNKKAIVLSRSQNEIKPGLNGEVFYRRQSVHVLLRVSLKRSTIDRRVSFVWRWKKIGIFIDCSSERPREVARAVDRLALIDKISRIRPFERRSDLD
jgi:hypothetical protein